MARQIDEYQLRADTADVVDAVVAGETFVVTRNGDPVAEVRPLSISRRPFVTRVQVARLASPAVRIDRHHFREDAERETDQQL